MIRGLYFTNAVCQETETTDGERSSEKKKLVITFLLATVGFLIGYVHSMAFYTVVTFQTNANVDINLYSDLENGFQFLFGYSLCLNPLVYAFRSAHFKEGFRRVLRAVHSGGAKGAVAPARKTKCFFSNIVSDFAGLFLVAILVRNLTKTEFAPADKKS